MKRINLRPFELGKFVLTVELVVFFFIGLRPASDPDYGWHVTNGGHVIDGRIFSGHDLYSWTATGRWVAHEWLTEFAMNTAHAIGGRPLNSVLAAVGITLAFAVLALALRRRSFGWGLICATLLLAFFGSLRSLAVRPHVIEMVGVAVTSLMVDQYLREERSGRHFMFVLFCVSVFWANTHGSFPLVSAILGITAVELFLSGDVRWRTMAAGMMVSAASFIINPWGIHLYAFALQSIRSQPTLSFIQEWQKPVITEWVALPLIVELTVAFVAIITAWSNRSVVVKAIPTAVGTIRALAFGILALSSGRHVMIFGIANIALLASGLKTLTPAFPRSSTPKVQLGLTRSGSHEIVNAIAALAVAGVLAVQGWRNVSPSSQRAALKAEYPVGVLSSLLGQYRPGDRLLNEYRWGGFLIENSNIPVFIDGRSEVYGDNLLARYASIVHLDTGWQSRFDSLGVTLVLMPDQSRIASALTMQGWKVAARDSVGVLLRRQSQ